MLEETCRRRSSQLLGRSTTKSGRSPLRQEGACASAGRRRCRRDGEGRPSGTHPIRRGGRENARPAPRPLRLVLWPADHAADLGQGRDRHRRTAPCAAQAARRRERRCASAARRPRGGRRRSRTTWQKNSSWNSICRRRAKCFHHGMIHVGEVKGVRGADLAVEQRPTRRRCRPAPRAPAAARLSASPHRKNGRARRQHQAGQSFHRVELEASAFASVLGRHASRAGEMLLDLVLAQHGACIRDGLPMR